MTWIPRVDASAWPAPGWRTCSLVAVAILAVQAAALLAMGHSPICTCGTVELWYGPTAGPGTSQHLTDWYTFTHVVHGFLFYLLLWIAVPGAPFSLMVLAGLGIEAGWEIVENTPIIIERYRQTALAAGYFGDSVVNSLVDSIAMLAGFVMARRLPVWWALGLVLAMEVVLALVIRDNLTLNVVQLIHPIEAISHWQAGG
ncbi:DUF2585 family protein [Ectothiorhodospiraceae bacterium WFHF3C12]|nr:DUF2585 family protein [Ectothiorhodospiraceae bacterium WFHF3C12]